MESRCEPDAAVRCCLSVGDPFACRYLTNQTLRPSGGTVARDWVSKNAAASVSRRVERLLFRLISSLPSRAAWFCNKGSFFMGIFAPEAVCACYEWRVYAVESPLRPRKQSLSRRAKVARNICSTFLWQGLLLLLLKVLST